MLNRAMLIAGLAVIVPSLLVLIAIALLVRPASLAQPKPAAQAAMRPAGDAMPATGAAQPTLAPAPTPLPAGPPAPGFDGGGDWINSPPLQLADLSKQGKVVLVDFWTYGCYNCQNTLPYVKQWWEKYKDQGLVIVGVHTPEFQSEHELANVQAAVREAGIGWPVVQDNDYTIWRAYRNNYWPRFYLVDHRGQIIYDHIGEGAYDETDRQIAVALAAAQGR